MKILKARIQLNSSLALKGMVIINQNNENSIGMQL